MFPYFSRYLFPSQADAADALKIAFNRAEFDAIDAEFHLPAPDTVPDWLVTERSRAELEGRA